MNENEFSWPDGKQVAVSITFDDGRASQIAAGIPILDRFGVKGVFYLVPGRVDTQHDAWQAVADAGHEIGNHSIRHSCSGNFAWKVGNVLENYSLEDMAAELHEANVQLSNLFGTVPRTFAYPCGQTFVGRGRDRRSYVPVVAEQFLAGRGFRDEYLNRPGFVDLAKVGGTELDGLSFDQALAQIERARSGGDWVVFVGHEVAETGRQTVSVDVLTRLCEYCTDTRNGVWIDTVAAIAACVAASRGESS